MEKNVQKFIEKFKLEKSGFYDITPFSDGSLGFSAKKYFDKKNIDNVTQMSVYIYENNHFYINKNKKPIIIHATYGKVTDSGISLRSKFKLDEPVDLESVDEYWYNIKNDEFCDKNKRINAEDIINEIYRKHLLPTKFFNGFWTRLKIFFWRKFMFLFLRHSAKVFSLSLLIISGDKYSYEPFSGEGTLNGKIIESKFRPPLKNDEKLTGELEKSSKIDFFSYKVRHWPIIVYSIIHALGYSVFMIKDYKPIFLTTLFKNNFLTLIYVILSLSVIEIILPKSLIFSVKSLSRLASKTQYKKISI